MKIEKEAYYNRNIVLFGLIFIPDLPGSSTHSIYPALLKNRMAYRNKIWRKK
jgi:hypothetical protein